MSPDTLSEALLGILTREVEGGTPSPLIKDSGEIVVGVDERLVGSPSLFVGDGLVAMQATVLTNALVHVFR